MAVKKKINVKDMALGALSLFALMIVPKVGDVISSGLTSVRSMVSGRK